MAAKKGKRFEYKLTLGTDITGNPIRKSFYSTKSLADAKNKARKYEDDYRLKLLVSGACPQTKKFKDYAKVCLDAYKKPEVKGNTYNNTWLPPLYNRLLPEFGEMELNSILPIHVQRYINKYEKTLKPETLKKDKMVLSFIMQCAVDDRLCEQNPCNAKAIKKIKVQPAQKNVWTQEEYDVAYAFASEYENGLDIMLLMETGMTRSELLGLHYEDVDLKHNTLHIRQGLVSYHDKGTDTWMTENDGLKNGYRERSIPLLEPRLIFRLSERLKEMQDSKVRKDDYLICGPEGGHYDPSNWDKRVFRRFIKELTTAHPEVKPLSCHELRHTRAVLWEKQGIPVSIIFRLLGHKNSRMFEEVYGNHDNLDYYRSVLLERAGPAVYTTGEPRPQNE